MTISLDEHVARAIAPLAWAALGLADTLAQENRRTASLRHARAAIAAVREREASQVELQDEIDLLHETIAQMREKLAHGLESERAACEAIAREYAEDIPTTQIGDGMRFAAHAIAGSIAARKGKGERK
jgi:hypothetical protein